MNFDQDITRRGSGSLKWDLRPSLDPFWVADMDFASPPAVIEALQKRVAHGVFGYAKAHDSLTDAVQCYLRSRHNYEASQNEIVYLGGLVPALSLAARAIGEPDDSLLTCTPVYPPFRDVAKDRAMRTLEVPHIWKEDRWTFDFAKMEASVAGASTKVLLLCNPQNPLGRCFTKEEVIQVAEFCKFHDLILVSDEIHCDLILEEEKTPFYSALQLPDTYQQDLIVLQSPSKTYNIAGLGFAYAVIPDDRLRRCFQAAKGHTSPEINCLSYFAAEAAYREGESWRAELLKYLQGNRDLLIQYVESELPDLSASPIEATYLAWIDCSNLGLKNPAQQLEKAEQLFLSDGAYFGSPHCLRFNFGCPRSRVSEGLEKMKRGLQSKEVGR